MLTQIILGNICSLCAMVTDSVSGTRKKHSEILGIQTISQVFYGAGSMILKGYSAVAQNLVAILRNLAAIKNVKSRALEWFLIGLGVALGVAFNNRGLIGWLPIVANFGYSIAVFRLRDNERLLKLVFIVNMLMFAVFSYVILNYVGVATNLFVAVTTAVALIREKRGTKDKGKRDRRRVPSYKQTEGADPPQTGGMTMIINGKDTNATELEDGALDQVAGGLIIPGNGAFNRDFVPDTVVDDRTLEVLSQAPSADLAVQMARDLGVSTERISREEYELLKARQRLSRLTGQ